MAREQTPSKISSERMQLLRIDQRYSLARTVVRCAFGGWGLWLFRGAIGDLAGAATSVNLGVTFLADFKFTAAVTLAGGLGAWAAGERWLRHRKTEEMQGRIKELEIRLDPNRSSSGLTPAGKTNPNDRRS